jgi:hypothetical protein
MAQPVWCLSEQLTVVACKSLLLQAVCFNTIAQKHIQGLSRQAHSPAQHNKQRVVGQHSQALPSLGPDTVGARPLLVTLVGTVQPALSGDCAQDAACK